MFAGPQNPQKDLLTDNQKKVKSDSPNKDKEPEEEVESSGCCSSLTRYFSVKHYQKYFDVTTNQVLLRIFKAIVPFS